MDRKPDCPCKSQKCERRGYCEQCRAFHYGRGGLPCCERPAKIEKEKPQEPVSVNEIWDHQKSCQACRGCCKFRPEDAYFAPVFTIGEIDLVPTEQRKMVNFVKAPGRQGVSQIGLAPSLNDPGYLVCPFLDETTHLCGIYSHRPLDCRIWPLIIMKDGAHGGTVLACFNKEFCDLTAGLPDEAFKLRTRDLVSWFDGEGFAATVKRNPGLAWDYEPDTFVIRPLL